MRPPGGPLGPGPPSLGAPRSAGHRGRAGSGCGWVGAALAPVLCLLSKPVFKRSPKSPARQTPVRFGSVGNNSAAAGCVSISPQERESPKRPQETKKARRGPCAPSGRRPPGARHGRGPERPGDGGGPGAPQLHPGRPAAPRGRPPAEADVSGGAPPPAHPGMAGEPPPSLAPPGPPLGAAPPAARPRPAPWAAPHARPALGPALGPGPGPGPGRPALRQPLGKLEGGGGPGGIHRAGPSARDRTGTRVSSFSSGRYPRPRADGPPAAVQLPQLLLEGLRLEVALDEGGVVAPPRSLPRR